MMSLDLFTSRFRSPLVLRAATLSVVLALVALAGPRLGRDDIPELPTTDGSNDVPEMVISLVNNGAVAAANQPSKVKLSSLRGRVALLDMFWSQCPHCRDHAPHVVELYNEFKPRGFTVLGLATDKTDKVTDVRGFMRDTKITYPVGFVTNEVIAYYADSHNHGVPQMVLFGPDGKMVKRWIGWTDEIAKEVRTHIQEQLGKLPVVKPGSKASSRNNERRVTRA